VAVVLIAVAEHIRENPKSIDVAFTAINGVTGASVEFVNEHTGLGISKDSLALHHNPKAAPTKPYLDPNAFYPFYLKVLTNGTPTLYLCARW